HRRGRIELGRAAEITRRLVMVEPVEQRDTLIEIDLRFRDLGRDREAVIAEVGMELGRGRRKRACVMLRDGRGGAERERARHDGGWERMHDDLLAARSRCEARRASIGGFVSAIERACRVWSAERIKHYMAREGRQDLC